MATKSSPELLKKHLQVAEKFLRSHKYRLAIKKYRQALIFDYSSPEVYKGMGLAYFHLGKFKEAEKEYKQALELELRDYEIYYYLGTTYYYLGLVELAIIQFKKAIEMNSSFPPAYYSLGIAYEAKGRAEEAIANIQKAMALAPEVKSLVLYPYVFQEKKDLVMDMEVLSQILNNIWKQIKDIWFRKIYPSSSRIRLAKKGSYQDFINLGIELSREGKLDKAVEEYKKAIAMHPDVSLGYDELGQAYYHLRKMDLAEECFKKAVEVNPKYGTAYYHLGCIYYELGKLDIAAVQFKKAIEIDNQDAGAYYGLGVVYENKGLVKEAFELMEKAISVAPNVKNLAPTIISHQKLSQPPTVEKLLGKGGFSFALFHLFYLTLLATPLYFLKFVWERFGDRIEETRWGNILKRLEEKLISYLKRMEGI